MRAVLFAGQGAQKKGMGADLFDRHSHVTEQASQILGYSIRELCLVDPQGRLHDTTYTQPALFVVNHLNFLQQAATSSTPIDFLAGHSLGEYNALLAAGVFDFATGLRLVQKRGQLMGEARGGGMAAVLGPRSDEVRQMLLDNGLDRIDVANFNTPTQTVVSGEKAALEQLGSLVEQRGFRFIPLNTSAAFHSRFMRDAQEKFSAFLREFQFMPARIPVIANITARPYEAGGVADVLGRQVAASVKWCQSIEYLLDQGVTQFDEYGTTLLQRMVTEIRNTYVPRVQQNAPVINAGERFSPPPERSPAKFTARNLGCDGFRKDYGLDYAYVASAMYRGIASVTMVVRMINAGFMAYFGAGGFTPEELEDKIRQVKAQLREPEKAGFNLLCDLDNPARELETVRLYLKHDIRRVEAAAYLQMTEALVYYRVAGLSRNPSTGEVVAAHKIMAKVSRPEVAEAFMSPPPRELLEGLLAKGLITPVQASLAEKIPMAGEICVEADSGGHTDCGNPTVIFPAIYTLMRRMQQQYGYATPLRIGLAGGIGTPESATSAFAMGADFILTGSINQCTVEAGTSDVAKDLLQQMNIQDTAYAPAADMFEIGAKVQVLKKGVFFPARANKLFSLYQQYGALEEIPQDIFNQIEQRFFGRSCAEIWEERRQYLARKGRHAEIEEAEKRPKLKMANVFKWYFHQGTQSALKGDLNGKINFQIQTGPALGSFNQWVKGTELESWRKRHVDEIAVKIMEETAQQLLRQLTRMVS
jgi:trans-AT polyketide synthase/acyltransferase/oxidoreductase domain-containing protein